MDISYVGPARRTDLYLRGKHPELITTIYKIRDDIFEIYCENYEGDFDEFKKIFNYSIRIISARVELTNVQPNAFIEIIPGIADKEISKDYEGVPMNKAAILDLLMRKFPRVPFHGIDDSDQGTIIVWIGIHGESLNNVTYHRFLNLDDRNALQRFLSHLHVPVKFEIQEKTFDSKNAFEEINETENKRYFFAQAIRRQRVELFQERDNELWIDNVDKIFEGSFKKKDLYFLDERDYSCYVDFSVFPNIDVRNHLFLFQTVYLTPPIQKDINQWLLQSKIHRDEFMQLVARKRFKIILTQSTARYDIGFLNEVYATRPDAIVSMKGLGALLQIDLVEMAENYLLSDPKAVREMKSFATLLSDLLSVDAKFIYQMLVWPIKARRNSFDPINGMETLLGTPSFGVNKAIEDGISAAAKKDLTFDFTVNSPAIHTAHALNATYFPFKDNNGYSDSAFASVMGEVLNFYKNATVRNAKSYLANKDSRNSGVIPIQPIDIFELNDYVSITELERILSKDQVFPAGKRLMETLANLNEQEREKKIKYYSDEVNKILERRKGWAGTLDLGKNVFMDAAGVYTGFPAIGSGFSLLHRTGAKLKNSLPLVKNITDKLEEAFNTPDEANVHFLTKINRVAKIKRS